jgi:PAS domain S-box-containing protein
MDDASRRLCNTPDNHEALACGKWHCHESCWTDVSKRAIETGESVDRECAGGLHLYAVPILAAQEIIGSINVGYGDPPRDPGKLRELGEKYAVVLDELVRHAEAYESRPPYIIELAKRRLAVSARLIGEIVERKRGGQALRESRERLHSIFRAAPTGIGLVANRVLVDVNARISEMTGYSPEELLGASSRVLYPSEEEFLFVGREKYRQIAERGTGTVETRWRKKDGAIIDVLLSSTPIDPANLDRGVTFTALDITERKRAAEEKEKLQAQLLQAQKMESVGRLAGGVAHDFNNMLQVILGNPSIALKDIPPDSPLRESIEEIQKSAERSADLTRQLLAFARKQTIQPKVLDLNDTVAGMLKMLRRLIGEDINLAWMPGSDLWAVKMDPSQIDQILANLCVNARDAIAGAGNLTIETANVRLDDTYAKTHPECVPGDYVMMAVSDTGQGMDLDTRVHLFEPFFTTKEVGKGTGLGLATVFGIVKQNEGLINVYSETGQGTIFKIYLPRDQTNEMATEQRSVHRSLRGTETVLVVEWKTRNRC